MSLLLPLFYFPNFSTTMLHKPFFFSRLFRAILHSLQCMLIDLVSCIVMQFESDI